MMTTDRTTFVQQAMDRQAKKMREGTEKLRQEIIEKQTEKEQGDAPASIY